MAGQRVARPVEKLHDFVRTELRAQLPVSHDRVIYVGDGSSDIHVMLHVNRLNGLTIAVSENKYLAQIAKRTVLSDDAVSVLVPILEDIVGMGIGHSPEGRRVFPGLTVDENLLTGTSSWRKLGQSVDSDREKVYTLFPRLKERDRNLGSASDQGQGADRYFRW